MYTYMFILFRFCFLVCFFIFTHFARATPNPNTRWPVFVAPDKTILMMHGLIDTASCPPGFGKLLGQPIINVRDETCKTFCPGYWHWVGSSTGACHDLTTQFHLKYYDIHHYVNPDQTTNYSVVTAVYGDQSQPYFSFAFTLMTLAGEHWQCFRMHGSQRVSCTNDI